RIGAAIEAAVAAAEGRPLALRLTLTGATPAHARLVARIAEVGQAWRAEAQELAYRAAEDCWIEKIRLETTAPPTAAPDDLDALDVAGLLAASAQEPEFLAEIEGLKASLADKAPPGLLDELLRPSSAEWAARARDLLLGARA